MRLIIQLKSIVPHAMPLTFLIQCRYGFSRLSKNEIIGNANRIDEHPHIVDYTATYCRGKKLHSRSFEAIFVSHTRCASERLIKLQKYTKRSSKCCALNELQIAFECLWLVDVALKTCAFVYIINSFAKHT